MGSWAKLAIAALVGAIGFLCPFARASASIIDTSYLGVITSGQKTLPASAVDLSGEPFMLDFMFNTVAGTYTASLTAQNLSLFIDPSAACAGTVGCTVTSDSQFSVSWIFPSVASQSIQIQLSPSGPYIGTGTFQSGISPGAACGGFTCASGALGIESIVTPLPAGLPLFACGLGVVGLLGWRRNRKAQAASRF
jgi:hypothetical protein